MLPIEIGYLIWDDGYDGTIVNSNGNLSIDGFTYHLNKTLVMTVTDQDLNSIVYGQTFLSDDGSSADIIDGFKLLKGNIEVDH